MQKLLIVPLYSALFCFMLAGCGRSEQISQTPPQTQTRTRVPAEYEPVNSVFVGWKSYPETLAELTKVMTNQGKISVIAADGPETIEGVPKDYYRPINCPIDSVWIRDYGPIGRVEETGQRTFLDPIYTNFGERGLDDAFSSCLAGQLGSTALNKNINNYALDLYLDGGNIMLDSKGNLFMSKATYQWNSDLTQETVDNMLKEYFAVHTVHAFDYAGYPGFPADGTAHLDMFMKLLSDDTVLISSSNQSPYREAFEKAVEYFQGLTAPNGLPYRILRINGYEVNRTWYTYTNSLLVNGMVFLPVYEDFEADNAEAERVYLEGLGKNTRIFKINSDTIIKGGGALHCIAITI